MSTLLIPNSSVHRLVRLTATEGDNINERGQTGLVPTHGLGEAETKFFAWRHTAWPTATGRCE